MSVDGLFGRGASLELGYWLRLVGLLCLLLLLSVVATSGWA